MNMKKMRVFELATKLSIDPKELLKIAKDLAISLENTMSLVDAHDIERIKKRLERESEKQPEEVRTDASFEEQRVSSKVIRRRARVPAPSEIPVLTKEEESRLEKNEEASLGLAPEAQEISTPETLLATPAVQRPEEKEIPKEAVAHAPGSAAVETPAKQAWEPAPIVSDEIKVIPQSVTTPAATDASAKEKEEDKLKKKLKKKGKAGEEPAPVVVEEDRSSARVFPKRAPKFKEKEKEKEKEVFTQYDIYDDGRPSYGKKHAKSKDKRHAAAPAKKRKIRIGRRTTVLNLARDMGVKVGELIRLYNAMGLSANEGYVLSAEEAILAATEKGFEVEEIRDDIKEDYLSEPTWQTDDLSPRPPVVTVMGHVDHGKTSLLDAIRSENVAEGEFGGITQHIGAYQARCKDKLITFLDTPGHEAFTSMRARGAQSTDFVILVVAADDGVMDQTREAISHARAASIPIIVAVNKIDKPNANPQRVKEQLADLGLVPEAWGGDTIFMEVSAKKHTGIEELLEMILLQAEILDLKASYKGGARGVVLESKLDKSRGPMSTMLIQQGELKLGDIFVVGPTWGRVRAMFDFKGGSLNKATPATPAEILGLTTLPSSGDRFFVVPNEKKAREIVEYLSQEARQAQVEEIKAQVTLEDLYNQVMEGKLKALNLILKGDVHGTVEALMQSLKGIETGEGIHVNLVHSAVGGITENDILLASATQAVIVGFNVKPDPKATATAKNLGIDIKLYTVIYDLLEDIKQALAGMLEPVFAEVVQGKAEVRNVFKISRLGTIAGCMVLDGKVLRGAQARLMRGKELIFEGKIGSLKRFKDDVREVASGYECGISFDNYNDINAGDIIEVYTMERQAS